MTFVTPLVTSHQPGQDKTPGYLRSTTGTSACSTSHILFLIRNCYKGPNQSLVQLHYLQCLHPGDFWPNMSLKF